MGDNWWLRSPGNNNDCAAFVNNNGNVDPGNNAMTGANVNNTYAIRPDFPYCQKRARRCAPSVPGERNRVPVPMGQTYAATRNGRNRFRSQSWGVKPHGLR